MVQRVRLGDWTDETPITREEELVERIISARSALFNMDEDRYFGIGQGFENEVESWEEELKALNEATYNRVMNALIQYLLNRIRREY